MISACGKMAVAYLRVKYVEYCQTHYISYQKFLQRLLKQEAVSMLCESFTYTYLLKQNFFISHVSK